MTCTPPPKYKVGEIITAENKYIFHDKPLRIVSFKYGRRYWLYDIEFIHYYKHLNKKIHKFQLSNWPENMLRRIPKRIPKKPKEVKR